MSGPSPDDVNEAFSIIEAINIGPHRRDKISKLENLIQWFAKSLFDHGFDDALVSEEYIEQETYTLLRDEFDRNRDPVNFFRESNNRFEEIKTSPPEYYAIIFPVNLVPTIEDLIDSEFVVAGYEFERISQETWRESYYRHIEEDTEFKNFLDELPLGYRPLDNTHWRVSIKARDKRYAVKRAKELIEFWLGSLNYCFYGWKNHSGIEYTRKDQTRDKRLYPPRFILVTKCGTNIGFYRGDDLSLRSPLKLSKKNADRINNLYQYLRIPHTDSNDIENSVISTLQVYQRGMTASNIEDSFLYYWRGIEMITLTDWGTSSDTALKRVMAISILTDVDISPSLLNEIADKRNTLVHEGVDIRISKAERNAIKRLLDGALAFVLMFRSDYNKEEFESMLMYSNDKEEEKFYNLLDGNRNQLKDVARELPLFKIGRRLRQNRESENWMRPSDEWLLEYLSRNPKSDFESIPLLLVLSTKYLNSRVEELLNANFIMESESGRYSTTSLGEQYLDGNVDPGNHEIYK